MSVQNLSSVKCQRLLGVVFIRLSLVFSVLEDRRQSHTRAIWCRALNQPRERATPECRGISWLARILGCHAWEREGSRRVVGLNAGEWAAARDAESSCLGESAGSTWAGRLNAEESAAERGAGGTCLWQSIAA